MRVAIGGQKIEDIDYYSRVHQILDILTPAEGRTNTMVEGFGVYNETSGNYGMYAGRTKTEAFKPMSGLFNQSRYLPLELADAAEAVYGEGDFQSMDHVINNVRIKTDLYSRQRFS